MKQIVFLFCVLFILSGCIFNGDKQKSEVSNIDENPVDLKVSYVHPEESYFLKADTFTFIKNTGTCDHDQLVYSEYAEKRIIRKTNYGIRMDVIDANECYVYEGDGQYIEDGNWEYHGLGLMMNAKCNAEENVGKYNRPMRSRSFSNGQIITTKYAYDFCATDEFEMRHQERLSNNPEILAVSIEVLDCSSVKVTTDVGNEFTIKMTNISANGQTVKYVFNNDTCIKFSKTDVLANEEICKEAFANYLKSDSDFLPEHYHWDDFYTIPEDIVFDECVSKQGFDPKLLPSF